MFLLDWLVEVFVQTFGITAPSVAAKRRAGVFILALLLAALALPVLVGNFAYHLLHGR